VAFQFRFARIKSIRELEEDLAQQRLALAKEEEKVQEARLVQAREQERRAFDGFSQQRTLESISLELEFRNCHEMAIRTVEQARVRFKAGEQVEEDREHLIMRMQKAKIMQSLHDRYSEVFHEEEALVEQKVVDDISNMQHLRKTKAGR